MNFLLHNADPALVLARVKVTSSSRDMVYYIVIPSKTTGFQSLFALVIKLPHYLIGQSNPWALDFITKILGSIAAVVVAMDGRMRRSYSHMQYGLNTTEKYREMAKG